MTIGGKFCGSYPNKMKGGNNWIEVKCKNPVSGKSIKIETTKNTNMCMSNIEIFGLTATATTPVETSVTTVFTYEERLVLTVYI